MARRLFCTNCGQPTVPGDVCPHCGSPYTPIGSDRTTTTRSLSVPALATIIGGGLVATGAFLPWIATTSAVTGNRTGIDLGDGLVAVGLGAVVAVIGLREVVAAGSRFARWAAMGLAALAIGIGAFETGAASDRIKTLDDSIRPGASIGGGIYLVIAGGVVALVGGSLLSKPRPRPKQKDSGFQEGWEGFPDIEK
jgi:hypothetical protein